MRTYTDAQRAHKREYDVAYRAATRERRKRLVAAYMADHKEEIRGWLNQYQNKWRKTLRGRIAMRLSNATRRKRVRETRDGTVTRAAVEALFKQQRGKCALCGKKLIPEKMHLDHIQPLVSGGGHTLANVQWTCAPCNLKKHRTRI